MSTIELFVKEFGESIEPLENDKIVVASSTRIEAIVDNEKFFKEYDNQLETYSIEFPKVEKGKVPIIKKGNVFFDVSRIKRILNSFKSASFEAKTYNIGKNNFLYLKINSEHGIVLAEKKEKRKELSKYEVMYEWDDIFKKLKITSDMIL